MARKVVIDGASLTIEQVNRVPRRGAKETDSITLGSQP